jgi:cbb3-type cytochrome oxidase subunit 3
VSLLQESKTRRQGRARCTSLRCMSVRSTIHNWWPIAAFFSFVLALQVVFANSIVANGKHASDHLQSAQVIFPVAFFLAVIFWAAREARRHADAWAAGAMVGLAFFVVALGNLRVIWVIGGDSWTDAQAGALGSARPGFDSGHSLVEIGTTAGVAAIVLFIAVLRTHRIVRTGPAIAAAALSLLPLIAPGIGPLALFGIVVLIADLCIQRAHQLKMAANPSDLRKRSR